MGAAGESKNYVVPCIYASSKLLTNVTAYTGFSARGGVLYFNACHYIRAAIQTATSNALDNYMTNILSIDDFIWSFMRNWAMCTKSSG